MWPQAYLEYNRDVASYLPSLSLSARDAAKLHYMSHGYAENRVYKRIPLLLRYTACGGLMNQHYSHISAITLAAALGADIIIPQALTRDSFASYFHMDPARNKMQWTTVPIESLWDIDYIRRLGSGRERASPT